MSDTNPEEPETGDEPATNADDIVRINMRLPQEKYEWLQEHLDSFTTDTARFQHLVQFYADHHNVPETRE